MAAPFVDERGPPAGCAIQLEAMRLAALDELVCAIARALLPLAPSECLSVRPQAIGDLGHAPRAAEVGAESREAVVHNARVRVVESGQHGGAGEVDKIG